MEEQRKATGAAQIDIPEEHGYLFSVFDRLTSVIGGSDNLSHAMILLTRYPVRPNLTDVEMTQDVWIKYHYATFIIHTIRLYDLCLALVSDVLMLGLPQQQVKEDTVAKNTWVVRARDIAASLKRIKALVDPFRTERNRYVHHGKAPWIVEIDKLNLLSLVEAWGKPVVSRRALRAMYRLAVGNIDERLGPVADKFVDEILALFESLRPHFGLRAPGKAT